MIDLIRKRTTVDMPSSPSSMDLKQRENTTVTKVYERTSKTVLPKTKEVQ